MTGEGIASRGAGTPLGRGLATGVAAGLAAGGGWWIVESVANWALGGVMPASVAMAVLGLDLAIGAVGGLVVGAALALAGRFSSVTLALGMAVVYGLIRIYEPPGLRGEAFFLVLGVGVVLLGARLAGERSPRRPRLRAADAPHDRLHRARQGDRRRGAERLLQPNGAERRRAGAAARRAADRGRRRRSRRRLRRAPRRRAVRARARRRPRGGAAVASLEPAALDGAARPARYDGRGTRGRARRDPDLDGHDARRSHVDVRLYARDLAASDGASRRTRSTSSTARSPAEWTVPGHASMFTGMYPSRHGAHYAGDWNSGPVIYGRKRVLPLADDKTTLAEVLQGARLCDRRLRRQLREPRSRIRHGAGIPALRGSSRGCCCGRCRTSSDSCSASGRRTARSRSAAPTTSTPPRSRGWTVRRHDRPTFVFLNYLEPHHWLAAPPYDLWSRDLPDARRLALKGLFTHAIPAGLDEEEREFVDCQLRRADPRDGRRPRSRSSTRSRRASASRTR